MAPQTRPYIKKHQHAADMPDNKKTPTTSSHSIRKMTEKEEFLTSLRIFRSYIKYDRTPAEHLIREGHQGVEDGAEPKVVDVSRVISRDCFETWVSSRRSPPLHPEKAFQRTLSAHVAGVDGRQPFPPEEEAALLTFLRKRRAWTCFDRPEIKFGTKGFRALGFHERLAGAKRAPSRQKVPTSKSAAPPASRASSRLSQARKRVKIEEEEDQSDKFDSSTETESGSPTSSYTAPTQSDDFLSRPIVIPQDFYLASPMDEQFLAYMEQSIY